MVSGASLLLGLPYYMMKLFLLPSYPINDGSVIYYGQGCEMISRWVIQRRLHREPSNVVILAWITQILREPNITL